MLNYEGVLSQSQKQLWLQLRQQNYMPDPNEQTAAWRKRMAFNQGGGRDSSRASIERHEWSYNMSVLRGGRKGSTTATKRDRAQALRDSLKSSLDMTGIELIYNEWLTNVIQDAGLKADKTASIVLSEPVPYHVWRGGIPGCGLKDEDNNLGKYIAWAYRRKFVLLRNMLLNYDDMVNTSGGGEGGVVQTKINT
jgi:hypothetical protein